MLILPTLSLSQGSAVSSLWEYITANKNMGITHFLGEFYLGNSGTFFVSLVVQ
jgi:hypothetical protein